jgi:hypothetical protein
MTMETIALGWTSLPILFFGGLILLILLNSVLRGSHRSARNKERSAVLQSMGFVAVPREQVFESVKATGRIIEDYATSVIFSPVGKGASALGETVIFDFQGILGDADTNARSTVVGFRVPPSIPDFEILHVLLLDRFVNKATAKNTSAPTVAGERKFGPFVVRPSDTPGPPTKLSCGAC